MVPVARIASRKQQEESRNRRSISMLWNCDFQFVSKLFTNQIHDKKVNGLQAIIKKWS
jgi:hypothetical protein